MQTQTQTRVGNHMGHVQTSFKKKVLVVTTPPRQHVSLNFEEPVSVQEELCVPRWHSAMWHFKKKIIVRILFHILRFQCGRFKMGLQNKTIKNKNRLQGDF